MKKLLPLLALVLLYSCGEIQEKPNETETGFLSLGIGIDIEQQSASGRLYNVVNTGDFTVIIYDENSTPVMTFAPFSSAPSQIELETGRYYVTASNDNTEEAAFDHPFYFGRSEDFTIDKEENKTINVTVALSNSKVQINYSDNVITDFDQYTGSVTVVSSNTTLDYGAGSGPGYFVSGGDLQVDVSLVYNKRFETGTISRTLTAMIPDALPKTQYNVNVDAVLVDGQIAINIIVDDSFDEIDVYLVENCNLLEDFLNSDITIDGITNQGSLIYENYIPLVGDINADGYNEIVFNGAQVSAVHAGIAPCEVNKNDRYVTPHGSPTRWVNYTPTLEYINDDNYLDLVWTAPEAQFMFPGQVDATLGAEVRIR